MIIVSTDCRIIKLIMKVVNNYYLFYHFNHNLLIITNCDDEYVECCMPPRVINNTQSEMVNGTYNIIVINNNYGKFLNN